MSTLYDKDVCAWSEIQSRLILSKKWDEIDIENIAEEIESLGKSYKRALISQLERLIMHMLKLRYQPNMQVDSNSWQKSINQSRRDIERLICDNPSLKRQLHQLAFQVYESARQDAAFETCLDKRTFP